MRKYDHPYFADWFAISLRWLVLIGVAYSLVLADIFNYYLAGAVLAGVLWNFFVSLLAIFNRRLPFHRILNVVFDFIGTTCLFYFSSGFFGPLSWIGLLSLFSSGIYFSWQGGILLAVLITTTQIGGSIALFELDVATRAMALLTGFNLLSGLLFGMLSQQLSIQLRTHYQSLRRERLDSDNRLQFTERQRMRDFYNLIEALGGSLDYNTVLRTALDLSIEVLSETGGSGGSMVCAMLMFCDEQLKIMEARGFPFADRQITFPVQAGVLEQVIKSNRKALIKDPANDLELSQILVIRDCCIALCLPINRGLDSYGVMLFAHTDEAFFGQDRQELLEVISHQVVIAIQNALLYKRSETEKERLVKAREEERKSLARELHDGPTQSVTGIAMRAEYIRRLLEKQIDKTELINELQHIEDLARKTTHEIRQMLFSLRPIVLENKGLANAIEALAQRMDEVFHQAVEVEVDQQAIDMLDSIKQTVTFQIVDEALNNARKHANASLISVSIKFLPETNDIALLEVEDNGLGFDFQSVNESYEKRGSLGFLNLHERADLINGRMNITSTPGKGTHVQVTIPLTEDASERLRRGKILEK